MANLEILNHKDPLTGFHTKDGLSEYLTSKLTSVYEQPPCLTIIILDLDNFKGINDKYGHMAGDDALRYFSTVMNTALRGRHFVARYGGDEFVIAIIDKRDGVEGVEVAKRIKTILRKERFLTTTGSMTITSSMGIASFPRDAKTPRSLLETADQALYYSKKHGRNRAVSSKNVTLYSVREKGARVFKVGVVVGLLYLFFLSYQQAGSFKGVAAYFQGWRVYSQYTFYHYFYHNNYCQIETARGDHIEGWIIDQNENGFVLTIKKPLMSLLPQLNSVSVGPPIKIPAAMIKSVAKSSR